MKLNPRRCAVATGLAFALLWVICSALVALIPGPMLTLSGHMVHAQMTAMNWVLTLPGFIFGLVAWSLLAAATAWLIALFYNKLPE